jgi:hypothetical protein
MRLAPPVPGDAMPTGSAADDADAETSMATSTMGRARRRAILHLIDASCREPSAWEGSCSELRGVALPLPA